MMRKLQGALMALVAAFGVMASSAPQAQAGHGRGIGLGIAAGIIGLGVGAALADSRPRYYSRYEDAADVCYRGPRECHWAGRHCFENRWGDTVCRGGRYVCERELICE